MYLTSFIMKASTWLACLQNFMFSVNVLSILTSCGVKMFLSFAACTYDSRTKTAALTRPVFPTHTLALSCGKLLLSQIRADPIGQATRVPTLIVLVDSDLALPLAARWVRPLRGPASIPLPASHPYNGSPQSCDEWAFPQIQQQTLQEMLRGQGGIHSLRMAQPETTQETCKSLSVVWLSLEQGYFLWRWRPLLCLEETDGSTSYPLYYKQAVPFALSLIAFLRFLSYGASLDISSRAVI